MFETKAKEQTQLLFDTPFSLKYWSCAKMEMKSVKILVLTALFIAMRIAVSSFFIPVGDNLRIYCSFFVNALGSMIYGPFVALAQGFVSDILGFIIHPSGAFFPGYVLTSMAGSFLYALFFYRTKISVLKIFLCKLSVNVLVNIGMGSLWSAMLYGNGFFYYAAKSIVKNITLLPFEVIVLCLFFRIMMPVLMRSGLIPIQKNFKISIL